MAYKLLSLRVPRESENTPEQTAQLLASLARATRNPVFLRLFGKQPIHLSLEVTTIDGQISFNIVYPDNLGTFVQSQMLATYQDVVMTEIKDYLPEWSKSVTNNQQPTTHHQLPYMAVVRQAYAPYFPLRDYADYTEVDPMLPLLGVLSKAGEGDRVLIQFVLTPASSSVSTNAHRYLHPTPQTDAEGHSVKEPPPLGKKLIEDKLSYPLVGVSIRFATSRADLIHDLKGAISVLNRPDGNSLTTARVFPWDRAKLWKKIRERRPFRSLFTPISTLNVMELSSLWHLPGVYTKLPNVAWAPSASITEAPENLPTHNKENPDANQDTNFFASTVFRNHDTIFGIKLEDRLRHMYVIGKSGTGKSTLLENMAVDDFKKGRGIAFIDPHGDSAENLLNYIPSNRINDTVYFDPAEKEFPISLNILEVEDAEQAELVSSGIVSIFHKLYGHSWGPRLEYILRNTLLTLTQIPGSTLPDVVRMLTQDDFRKKLYPQIKNAQLLSFWKDEYDRLEEKTRAEQISSILNKVGQFVNSPLIHNIISNPKSTLKLTEVINSGKILIVNLSQGKIGEDNASLLGAMIITQLELAAMARHKIPASERKPFFLFVDEFQNFATDSFVHILSEARKFKLASD